MAGMLTQGVAMLMFNSAIRFISSQTVAQMAFTEVLWVVVLGSVVYGESLAFVQIASIVVILLVVASARRLSTEKK